MRRSAVRGVLAGVVLAVAVILGTVQFASDAIFARAGEPGSLPAHLPPAFGAAVYERIASIAPAPYVDDMLAREALNRGDLIQAQRYAQRLPDSAKRDDVLAGVARARGDERAALAYDVRAGDIEAVSRAVRALQDRNPAYAYAIEEGLKKRLEQSGTHPDEVAEAYWRLGTLAWRQNKRALAVRDYRRAIALSPFAEKYLLSAGFTAYVMHDDAAALGYFRRAIGVAPGSADAYAGAGMAVLRQGDRARALYYAARARALNPHSHPLLSLESQLQK